LLVNYAFCELLEINNSFLVGAAALVSIVKSLASGFFSSVSNIFSHSKSNKLLLFFNDEAIKFSTVQVNLS
jgi:hypothetical protein